MAIEQPAAPPAVPPAAPPAQPPAPCPPSSTRLITLEHGDHLDSTLYRFEKGHHLEFCPGASLLGRRVYLYTNYVLGEDGEEEQAEFVRNQYHALQWNDARGGSGALITDGDVRAHLRLSRAGAYHYYFVYEQADAAVGPAGSGWFHVSPTLRAGPAGCDPLPLDAIACQTVLAKCLGPLSRWESTLRVARECGYNMLHFTPVQELGASGSGYSIANQLRLNPAFGSDVTFADVESLVAKMRTDWKVLSICDVVLNHTANETPWLAEHPEATYNCATCPHLRPAALLDALLARTSAEVSRGEHAAQGVPPALSQPAHVDALRVLLAERVVPAARLHELYCCDVDALAHRFMQLARDKVPSVGADRAADADGVRLLADGARRRLRASVDMELALQVFNVRWADAADEEARLRRCRDAFRAHLDRLNAAAADLVAEHLRAAVDNVCAGVRYCWLAADGPRHPAVSAAHPLAPRYFTWGASVERASLADLEAALGGPDAALVMAHNGWVMDADPLVDFAARAADGRVYLRRELLAWGDSVKLRYGAAPDDCPFLWARMRDYVELTAEVFDGLRLDNCHSTPLHVAEYMLDCARNVKPDLYVVAELFTNSDSVDNIYVNRLGLSALIREAQSAWDAREQGRLLHRFGGRPVGAFGRGPRAAARPALAPALLLDLTHDNPSPLQRRSVHDALPTAALCAMAATAVGSTRGLDELVPHHIHVVDEDRLYPEWSDTGEPDFVGPATGLVAARRALNELHVELAAAGYCELYVDQMDEHVVAVTRHHPRSRHSVVLVAYTAFTPPEEGAPPRTPPPLRFEGVLDEILLEASMHGEPSAPYRPHPRLLTGLRDYEVRLRRAVPLALSEVFAGERAEGAHTMLEFRPLRPGTVVALRVSPRPPAAAALLTLQRTLDAYVAGDADALGLTAPLDALDLSDFNVLLYRCDAEERDAGGGGVYDVPGHGPLPYAGLQGVASLLAEITPADDLGHALCDNLRSGDWLSEYAAARLERDPRLAPVAARYRDLLRPLAALPRFLVPTYFAGIMGALYECVASVALRRMSPWVRDGAFSRALALTSVQLAGAVPSAPLPAPSPALPPPRASHVTLSAGLPHFAVGYMRCWGRDTFIALRGLLLLTGRFQEARMHILGFAACLRHGLVPNLLDGGRCARYNCRDAVWWWLLAIQQYCSEAPGGWALLAEPVSRLFPRDDAEAAPAGVHDQPLHDVMQEALDVHFQGATFRERGAGRAIDAHMADKGFNVQIGVDPETGFPFGGNDSNCGTWMDKMGSSEAAGTRGTPATPRDGSAVELVALAYSAAAWLSAAHRAARYPYPGVVRRQPDGSLTSWTFAQWADRIRRCFERHFWVPPAPSAADARPDLVHRRAIYKDTHGASRPWADYQLRCNFPVAMAIAPDLFEARHAWLALDAVEELLLGPLGVKTLDPADWAYRADYNPADDSADASVAHGFNYHQGPEWVWPLGFYLRARLAFAHECGKHARTVAAAYAALAPLLTEIRTSPWRGLPELTNAGGAPCPASCRTQAWSSGAVLEALHALEAAQRARPLPAD